MNNAYLHAFEEGSHGTVKLTAHQEHDRVVIELRDDGVGMTEAMQEQMFLPFFSTKLAVAEPDWACLSSITWSKNIGRNLHAVGPGEGSVFRLSCHS